MSLFNINCGIYDNLNINNNLINNYDIISLPYYIKGKIKGIDL